MSETESSLLTFPCAFPIKAMGHAADDFADLVIEIVLRHVRERIESTFHCLQNTGRNLERLLAKTVPGLCSRVIAKVTSLVLKHVLRYLFAIDVQSFSLLSNSH